MSAIQLLEQLGASATLQRQDTAEAQSVKQAALDALDTYEKPVKQWCILFPADDESPSDDKKDKDQEDDQSISLH